MPQIANIGQRIFSMIVDAGYWIILVMASVEVLKSVMRRDYEGALRLGFQAAVSYFGLKLIPILLNMVKGAF